jgi:hypothetical protein
MPDGDKVHAYLPQRYQKVYQQVCEGYLSEEELSYEVSQPLIKDIQQYGDTPIQLIAQVAGRLEQVPTGPLFKGSDYWAQMSQEIDNIAQQQAYGCNRRGLDLAIEGCKEKLLDLRSGEHPGHLRREIIQNYLRKVYLSNCEERVPLSQQHHGNVSQEIVNKRLKGMRPHLEKRITVLSRKLAQKGTVNSLNPSSLRRSKPSIGMYDNLLAD